jgi:hypothetical protein
MVVLNAGGEWHLAVGGGSSNHYVVYMTFDNMSFLNLLSRETADICGDRPSGPVVQVGTGVGVEFSGCLQRRNSGAAAGFRERAIRGLGFDVSGPRRQYKPLVHFHLYGLVQRRGLPPTCVVLITSPFEARTKHSRYRNQSAVSGFLTIWFHTIAGPGAVCETSASCW